ncbi:MAG TPA: ribonuclease H-like domain-containing protein [Chitinophagaceae bacterium]
MQIDEQRFLDLAERSGALAFVDIESTGLTADYNNLLVVSIKPYEEEAYSFVIKQAGNDQRVVREAKEALEQYELWVTYYGKGFDIGFMNTRLLKWGQKPIEKRPHLDLFYSLKYNTRMSRKSLAHFGRWLKCDESKMDMSPDDWIEAAANPSGPVMKKMVQRCESDCLLTENLYKKTRHLVRSITK